MLFFFSVESVGRPFFERARRISEPDPEAATAVVDHHRRFAPCSQQHQQLQRQLQQQQQARPTAATAQVHRPVRFLWRIWSSGPKQNGVDQWDCSWGAECSTNRGGQQLQQPPWPCQTCAKVRLYDSASTKKTWDAVWWHILKPTLLKSNARPTAFFYETASFKHIWCRPFT